MKANQTYCGDHFAIYTDFESCCTTETNKMLYVNLKNFFKKNGFIN